MKKDFIVDILQKQIEGADLKVKGEEIGKVVSVGDGVVTIEGLPNCLFSEQVLIEKWPSAPGAKPLAALVLSLEEYSVEAVVLGDDRDIKEGDIVRRTKQVLSVPVGEGLLGRVVNPLGVPLDGKGVLSEKQISLYPVERPAPSVMMRQSVTVPLATGIKLVDATLPIGRGQRELIIGDRQIGKTSLVEDVILNQLHEPKETRPVCVYVAIGQKSSKVAQLVKDLESKGAMEYTIVVAATASDPAPFWYVAPYAGCSMGEYFRDKGRDALIIYDDLSKHAWAWRQIALLLKRPPGREAYPGDVFYLHSRLLERAARLSKDYGGGSLTALPIVETQMNDVSAYIPTNVISITDGQIFLEQDLFFKGQRPAVNIGISVSRVGSAAQTKAMKKVASQLKLELAQFQELASFAQFSQDLDEATKKRINRGQRLMELLKQDQYKVLPLEEEVCSLWCGIQGYLDALSIEQVLVFETKLLETLRASHKELLKRIRDTKDFDDKVRDQLKIIVEELLTHAFKA